MTKALVKGIKGEKFYVEGEALEAIFTSWNAAEESLNEIYFLKRAENFLHSALMLPNE